jgi:hypothetical protein
VPQEGLGWLPRAGDLLFFDVAGRSKAGDLPGIEARRRREAAYVARRRPGDAFELLRSPTAGLRSSRTSHLICNARGDLARVARFLAEGVDRVPNLDLISTETGRGQELEI